MDAGLYQEMNKHCKDLHISRIENRIGDPGFPDTVCLHRPTGIVALVELKELYELANGSFQLNMRKGQPAWHHTWAANNGRSFVFAKSKEGTYILSRSKASMLWIQTITCSFELTNLGILSWKGQMDWEVFQNILIA